MRERITKSPTLQPTTLRGCSARDTQRPAARAYSVVEMSAVCRGKPERHPDGGSLERVHTNLIKHACTTRSLGLRAQPASARTACRGAMHASAQKMRTPRHTARHGARLALVLGTAEGLHLARAQPPEQLKKKPNQGRSPRQHWRSF